MDLFVTQRYCIWHSRSIIQPSRGFGWEQRSSGLQGHQPEMSDSVKLFLRDAKKHRFQIDFFWKSIDYHFLYQNFIDLCQIVCLLHGFEVTAKFPPQNWFPIEICLQSIFDLLSFLNDLSYRCEIGLVWKIIWCSFRKL